ncbi:ComEC/Rec2 family competence protein [Bacillus sp. FJAT-27264]|uniref:ComEC/Rec2 family competence protein n=1 Tax=Paenibacillus sp. (strain DSM 101736 / FJAT-27264) TaxID=1850362 RepID=UPI0009F42D5C|nr:ComEC/Rec2 family competence protein [Bacillus sp. FJAT-27264]
MKARPLLSFTVCWVIGSTAACLYSGSRLLLVGAGLLLLLAALVCTGRLSLKYVAVLAAALVLSGGYWEWNEVHHVSRLPDALQLQPMETREIEVLAEGFITSPVDRDGDRADFTMKVSGITRNGELGGQEGGSPGTGPDHTGSQRSEKSGGAGSGEQLAVQVKLQAESEIEIVAAWKRGDRVKLTGVLEQPQEARNFGGFDYRAYLQTRDIYWLLKVTGAETVETAPPASWSLSTVLRWNDGVRASLGAELDRLFEKLHSGYMKGLIIGMQDDLDPDTFRQFSQLGLTHILAISGMHVAVYVGAILFLLKRCRLTRETTLTVTFMLVPVYVLLSGAGPSVIRAGLMSMIALAAARAGILKDGLNILCASALVMLIWNPYMLVNVSFQLSFLVTAGLMIYVPLADVLLRRLPSWLRSAVSVTVVAQFISFPLTIYYFNQFSLMSFIANLVLVPFITFVILPLGTVALLLGRLWGDAASLLATVTELLNNITFGLVEWINGFPGGVMIWRSPSLLWICIYYAFLFGLLYFAKLRIETRDRARQYTEDETRPLEESMGFERFRDVGGIRELSTMYTGWRSPALRWSGILLFSMFAGFSLLLYQGYRPDQLPGGGSISYLDIGQGDSTLITTPGGSHILVDGGGTVSFGKKEEWRIRRNPFEVGAKVLVPLLKKRGIHRLDAIILTHADQDHAGGLQAVLENIPVSSFLFNGTMAEQEPYKKLMGTALEAGVRLYAVHQGMELAPDDATRLFFLWPQPLKEEEGHLPEPDNQNHASVVFRLNMNERNFLFTGDMDMAAEEEIVAQGGALGFHAGPQIDVLKAAHHGSKTSTGEEWLQFWRPAATVISAGVNNMYGHPAPVVMERLVDNGTTLYRTDRQGEIQMKVTRDEIKVRHKLDGKAGE